MEEHGSRLIGGAECCDKDSPCQLHGMIYEIGQSFGSRKHTGVVIGFTL